MGNDNDKKLLAFATFLLACFLSTKESTYEIKKNVFCFTSKLFSRKNQSLEF